MTFTPGVNTSGRSVAFNNTIFNPGNEPSFTTPYLYNFVGRQDLSVKQSRNIAKSYYSPTPGGLPGNSDAGAMESWLIWNILGLYPMVGQTTFLIGSPWFANTTISLDQGKSLAMTTTGGSDSSYYVQSLKVNGQPWTQSWLTWNDVFANGGTIDFVLGADPKNWTTGKAPPSPASEFADTTAPSAIVTPGKVSTIPSPPPRIQNHHRRKMLRDIAFALMSLGVVSLISGSAAAIWWFRFKKPKSVSAAEVGDQEKGKQELNEGKEGEAVAEKRKKGLMKRSRENVLFFFGKRKPDTAERPTSKGVSLTMTVASEDGHPSSRKKDLKIDVSELPRDSPADEPWTPRGTNRAG
jgi:hypothetical protein